VALSHNGARVAYNTLNFIEVQDVSNPQSLPIRTLPCPDDEYIPHLSFNNGQILHIMNGFMLQSFNDETGEEIGRYVFDDGMENYGLDESFINIRAIHDTKQRARQPISDIAKPYYIFTDGRWLHKNGEDILWLPSDYMPKSACMVGLTIVIGTMSGRLLFLYLRV
jgi:hypothetical protein